MMKFKDKTQHVQIRRIRLALKISLLITFHFIIFQTLNAQLALPLTTELNYRIEPSLLAKNPEYFTFLKPYDIFELSKKMPLDSLLSFDIHEKRRTWFGRKLLQESFLQVDSTDFSIRVDPLFNLMLAKESGNNQQLITNTRGIRIRGSISKTIGFESSLYENQSFFPTLTDSFIFVRRVAPGQGRAKPYHKTGWDYAYSSASFTWRPGPHFFLQFATDKLFIGDGYRSLLLSDISSNYPFIRFTLNYKNFQYTRIMAELTDIDYKTLNKDIGKFPGKTANFHLISTNILKTIQISIFESTILKNPDHLGKLHITYNLVSPIPFSDLLNTSETHPILGLNIKWAFNKSIILYNQWVFDHLFNKPIGSPSGLTNTGVQVGMKYYNVVGIKNLTFQAEYNEVQPNTYAHSDTTLAYSNFSQPLAHPLGANFREKIIILSYSHQRFYITYQGTWATYGASSGVIFHGDDILHPAKYPQTKILAGPRTTLNTHAANISYKINPATNSSISIGMNWRKEQLPTYTRSMKVFFFSFSTNLRNLYSDF